MTRFTLVFEDRVPEWFINGMTENQSFQDMMESLKPDKIIIERDSSND